MVRRAFTLIELMVVVVIIGLLLGIAIPKYQGSRKRTFVSLMKADLHNLMSAQAAYVTSANAYSDDSTVLGFHTTRGNVLSIPEATSAGWIARVTHPGAAGVECVVFVGIVGAATTPATTESQITCTP
ncbi:MAG: prepilin-type N-terminal cleavage/methylation domain-containing protein [Gemmatimonadota bacterium]|jgi:prepilin-type N-terminal cleavage/methylation domain-containing protein|nr:prepilin-type N-terminal cleavage/methylation domain-containing protein [Gemmatimonadota bacterium]MDQ8177447.1 prepilin-type N-terminal cleavage/methylation domain-containing protein [Gemmatimonadota bacterium]